MFSKVASVILPDHARKAAQDEHIARIAITEDGRIAYASPAFCALSHREPEHIKNAHAAELISFSEAPARPQTISTLQPGLHKIYINGHEDPFSFHFEWLKTPDNRRFLVGSQSNSHKKPSKALMEQLTGILRATPAQQKQSAPSSTMADAEAARLLDLSQEAMIITGDLGELLQANKAFCNIFEYEEAELTELHFLDLFYEEDRPYIRSSIQAFDLRGFSGTETPPQNFQARIVTKTGQIRWMEWTQQLCGEKLYCTGRDITDIKTQQNALKKREKQLTEAESIGRMGHWHWTIGELDMQWSDELYRIFGVSQDSFSPTLETMNKMVHRSDIARLNQAFQRALIEENDYDMEFRIITSSGETRYIRCEGRCARDESGEVSALYGIMQDMTERTLHEDQLRAAKENAERAYAARTQFLANMSHELRTPLNAIIGFSEMMQHQLLGPLGNEKYLEYIAGIRESGEHLLDLISDILDMSKIEAGKYELDLSEIQPGKLIKLATHMMEGRAHEAKVKLQIEGTLDENLKIVADRRAVLQILLNLLSNAVKFTEEGGEIKVQMRTDDKICALTVSDNGIGIPAHKLATITRPFEQVSSSYARDHQGSGLGLAITKELAEMHGGALNIESTYGEGTAVTIKLPLDAFKAQQKKQ